MKPSGSVPGNKKSAGSVAVAVQMARLAASIRAFGKSRVVATPPVGFGRAGGGAPIKTSAAHITNKDRSCERSEPRPDPVVEQARS